MGRETFGDLEYGQDIMRWNWVLFIPAVLAGCDDSTGPDPDPTPDRTFDFSAGLHGWDTGFADYPPGEEERFELVAGHRPLPAPLDTSRRGILVSGDNQSDDLLMYIAGTVEDLTPSARYAVRLRVVFASDAPAGCAGVGGAPGESVYVKATALAAEPVRFVDETTHWRLNADLGNQADPGAGQLLGDIATDNTDCGNRVYAEKALESVEDLIVRADGEGRIWLVIGVDSGFEATTSLYFLRVEARLQSIAG